MQDTSTMVSPLRALQDAFRNVVALGTLKRAYP